MVNEKLINAFLYNTTKDNLIAGIKAILNHFKIDSEYEYENRVNNIVNIIGGDKLPTMEDIDIDLLKKRIGDHVYKAEEIDIDSIEVTNIDVIDKTISVKYTRIGNNYSNTDRINYTNYLKNVKEN